MKTKLEAALETFTLLYNKKILPKLKRKDKLNSEINQLNSERNKLNSEINKLNSERNKFNSKILMDLYRFGKENDCVVVWDTYDFKLSEIKLKSYNQDKTGFLQIDSKGKIIERLFEEK